MKKTISPVFKKYLLTLPLLGLSYSHVFAAEEGEVQTSVLDPIARSYILSNNGKEAAFSDGGISKEKSKSVGVDVVSSDSVNLYAIPISYGQPVQLLGGEEFINVSADIPYLNAEAPVGNENGLGDIGLGAEYFIEKDGIILKTELNIKLPTGDEKVGLGSGSTDFGVSFTGRKRVDDLGFNATAGYILRGEATINRTDIDYGNVITLAGGAEYRLQNNLWGGANLAYARTATTDNGGFEADGLQTLDLIPNISYRINTDMTVTADLILPLQESVVDGDFPSSTPERETTFSLGFNSDF